eukprot:scaffold329721_cov29-Prasinocladus_malaysianus.AAC.1
MSVFKDNLHRVVKALVPNDEILRKKVLGNPRSYRVHTWHFAESDRIIKNGNLTLSPNATPLPAGELRDKGVAITTPGAVTSSSRHSGIASGSGHRSPGGNVGRRALTDISNVTPAGASNVHGKRRRTSASSNCGGLASPPGLLSPNSSGVNLPPRS